MDSTQSKKEFDRIIRVLKSIASFFKPRLIKSEPRVHIGTALSRRSIVIEMSILSIIVLIFCAGVLDFGTARRLPGNESEVFQFLDWTLYQSLRISRTFPLWNPYLDTGHPFVADPMLHVYNPVATVPVLLFGVVNGFKIGIAMSFIFAALGMWHLGVTLGLRRAPRLWLALMYTFAGQPIARFFQGQYLFIFGFAWIPWAISMYIRALETGRRKATACTVLFLGLLFFSGNVYYSFYTLFALAVLSLTQVLRFHKDAPKPQVDTRKLRSAVWIALLSLGFIAIQLLPLIQYRPFVNKASEVAGSHTIQQIFLDLTSKDTVRPDAFSVLPAREEFYAYIGLSPFLALIFLPFAIRRKGKSLLPFVLILLISILWIMLESMPWRNSFYGTELLAQFRHLLRILIFTNLSLLVISALAFDYLLTRIDELRTKSVPKWFGALQFRNIHLAQVLVILIMGFGVVDLYVTHRPIIHLMDKPDASYQAAAWLRAYDEGVYYVRHNPNNASHEALIANNLRFIDAWYHFTEIRRVHISEWSYPRSIDAVANYIIQSKLNPPIEAEGVELIKSTEERDIFKLNDSLPFAFVVPTNKLNDSSEVGPILRDDIEEILSPFTSPNSVEVIHNGGEGETLIVLSTFYPGWKVYVNGEQAVLRNASNFLSTEMKPGTNKYEFVYRPRTFYTGLTLSTFTFFVMVLWVWQEQLLPLLPLYSTLQRLRDPAERRSSLQKARAFFQEKMGPLTSMQWFSRREPIREIEGTFETQKDTDIFQEEPVDVKSAFAYWLHATRTLFKMFFRPQYIPAYLFGLSILTYLLIRLIGLSDFPIYFFTDEAVQTVLAADLVRDGFHGYDGVFLPTYFENAWLYNLSLSVYAQVLPYLLFGKTIFVTRATSVVIGLTGAVAVALILRDAFQLKHWWAGVLVFSAVPAWFLHSRTAFETVIFVVLMAWMLYFYLRYRQEEPRYLYAAIAFGGLSFYSYRGGQLVLIGFAAALFLVDIRYHIKNRRTILRGLLLVLVFTLPYFRFQVIHRDETYFHLRMLDTYWLYDISLREKVLRFIEIYLNGLDPRFWFAPEGRELSRHIMKGHGHISPFMAPFLATGLVLSLVNIKKPHYRATLMLALLSPLGAALVGIGITRVLIFVLPTALLTTLGISAIITSIKNPRLHQPLAWLLFSILLLFNSAMLWDALSNGPTWYRDYGLGGMQYGAKQVFGTAERLMEKDSNRTIYVSSTWANGTDILMRFFIPDGSSVYIGNADGFLDRKMDLDEKMTFILTAEEFQRLVENSKISNIEVLDTIDLPDKRTGFYVTTFSYSPQAESIFAEEEQARAVPRAGTTQWEGQTIDVRYPFLDMGELHHIFDEDTFTLARVHSANPAVFKIIFEEPTTLAGVRITTGSMDMQVTVNVQTQDSPDPLHFDEKYIDLPDDPTVTLPFDEAIEDIIELQIEILSLTDGNPFKIHIRELEWYISEPVLE